MDKKISTTKENREFLAKTFACTERAVYKAINFESNTEEARRIRHLALQRGGQLVTTLPVCETIHDAGGVMRQEFPNGAVVIGHKCSGLIELVWNNKVMLSVNNPTITELSVIQTKAAAL
jgi:hypothetical protein